MHWSTRLTRDVDVTRATTRDNLDRLAAALREFDARIRTDAVPEGPPFDASGEPPVGHRTLNLQEDRKSRSDAVLHGRSVLANLRFSSRTGGAAPQPAEDAGCNGSPEGRCASLRDGPAAHPSPDPPQPGEAGCAGAARNVGEHPQRLIAIGSPGSRG
ncbi:hypothetical protein [Blastococcus colisei]|uniref:hypothetical protein n=1 Tax=Blastococcus colisei TaxID=1564162 RepID=UPI00115162B7|nr:hypothetical protein [Blastococcus colisei]